MARGYKIIEKHGSTGLFAGANRYMKVRLDDGRIFHVGVERGARVRIAFKPVGPGAYGFKWYGFVRDEGGRTLWHGRVPYKSTGASWLLIEAGIIECCHTALCRAVQEPGSDYCVRHARLP